MPDSESGKSKRNYLILVPVVLILMAPGYSIVSSFFSGNAAGDQPFLEKPDSKYKRCIKRVTYMRFHHWELLRDTREEVVRYGSRGAISLAACRECHTSRERFCNRCHEAVSLYPDCFDCHHYP